MNRKRNKLVLPLLILAFAGIGAIIIYSAQASIKRTGVESESAISVNTRPGSGSDASGGSYITFDSSSAISDELKCEVANLIEFNDQGRFVVDPGQSTNIVGVSIFSTSSSGVAQRVWNSPLGYDLSRNSQGYIVLNTSGLNSSGPDINYRVSLAAKTVPGERSNVGRLICSTEFNSNQAAVQGCSVSTGLAPDGSSRQIKTAVTSNVNNKAFEYEGESTPYQDIESRTLNSGSAIEEFSPTANRPGYGNYTTGLNFGPSQIGCRAFHDIEPLPNPHGLTYRTGPNTTMFHPGSHLSQLSDSSSTQETLNILDDYYAQRRAFALRSGFSQYPVTKNILGTANYAERNEQPIDPSLLSHQIALRRAAITTVDIWSRVPLEISSKINVPEHRYFYNIPGGILAYAGPNAINSAGTLAEECLMGHNSLIASVASDLYRDTVAHELAHCLSFNNIPFKVVQNPDGSQHQEYDFTQYNPSWFGQYGYDRTTFDNRNVVWSNEAQGWVKGFYSRYAMHSSGEDFAEMFIAMFSPDEYDQLQDRVQKSGDGDYLSKYNSVFGELIKLHPQIEEEDIQTLTRNPIYYTSSELGIDFSSESLFVVKTWSDDNKNGIQDQSEQPLGNIVVEAVSCGTGTSGIASGLRLGKGKSVANGQAWMGVPLSAAVSFVAHLPGGYELAPANQGGNDNLDSDIVASTKTSECYPGTSASNVSNVGVGLIPKNDPPVSELNCSSLQVLTLNNQVNIEFNSPGGGTITVDHNDPTKPGTKDYSISAGLNKIEAYSMPQSITAKDYNIEVSVATASDGVDCPPVTVAIEPPNSLNNIEFINPDPYRQSIKDANSISDIEDVLNQFAEDIYNRGQQLGQSNIHKTTFNTNSPRNFNESWVSQLNDSPEDVRRFKIAANAIMDGISRIPLRLFNYISVDEIYVAAARDNNNTHSFYTACQHLVASSKDSIVIPINGIKETSFADGAGDSEYYWLVSQVADSMGGAFDCRGDLAGDVSAKIFYGEFSKHLPGGPGFEYLGNDWQNWESNSINSVRHDNQDYPESFTRPFSTTGFESDFRFIFTSLLAENNSFYGYGTTVRSNFDSVLVRANQVDPKLRGKMDVTIERIKRFEPNFSIDAARDINYTYGCLDCSL